MKTLALLAMLLFAAAPPGRIVVQPGDTLFKLAERHLGNGNRYPELAAANNLQPPYAIVDGQTLVLPDGTAARPQAPAAAPAAALRPPATAAASSNPAGAAPAGRAAAGTLPPLTASSVNDGIPLTLREALDLAAAHNLSLLSGRITPRTAANSVLVAEAAFDPTLSASVGEDWSRSNRENPDNVFSARSDQSSQSYSAGISQSLRTGTDYDVSLSSSHSRTSPSGSQSSGADISVSLSQPLLEGRGRDIVEAPLNSARQSHAAAVANADRLSEQTVLAVENAYWALAQAEANEQISRSSLTVAEALQQRGEELLARGLLAQIEVLTARSGAATRRDALVTARLARENSAEALAFLILGERRAQERVLYRTATIPPPVAAPGPIAELEARALAARADLTAARAALAGTEIDLRVRANALLPDLSLTGGAGTGGSAIGFDDAWDDLARSREPNWSVGLSLSVPLGNVADKARYDSAKLALEKQRLALQQTENDIRKEVRDAHRAVTQGLVQLSTAGESRRLSEELLQAELQRLELGLGDTQKVLNAEEDAAQAQLEEARARCSLAAAQAKLTAALGGSVHQGEN